MFRSEHVAATLSSRGYYFFIDCYFMFLAYIFEEFNFSELFYTNNLLNEFEKK